MRFSRIYYLIIILQLMVGCINVANIHRALDCIIDKSVSDTVFPTSSDKYNALKILVHNAPDSTILSIDSLVESINYAYDVWQSTAWNQQYSKSEFYEYVLPSLISNEPQEYYWRWDIPHNSIPIHPSSGDLLAIAKEINSQININYDIKTRRNNLLGYTATVRGDFGKCDDRAVFATMAMRSYGIPAAFEYIPSWGDMNTGHTICSVIMPDGAIKIFQDDNESETETFFTHKVPKIYRRMYSMQSKTVIYKNRHTESIPFIFNDFRLMDVTQQHGVGQNEKLRVPISSDYSSKIAYLSVFSPLGWLPVAYTKNRKSRTTFSAVGNGANRTNIGENIGDGILYLPSLYVDNLVVPASIPIIVSENRTRKIEVGRDFETVVLTRKYPRLQRITTFAKQMVGGIFEGANRPDFTDAVELYRVESIPDSRMQLVKSNSPAKFKYIRYRKPAGNFSIAEFHLFDRSGERIQGKIIGSPAIVEMLDFTSIYDNVPLTYFEVTGGIDLWAGIALTTPTQIDTIQFAPRNDDNEIWPDDQYELFYWNDAWLSLGQKIATEYKLTYDNVPKGALLWLRNLSKGTEERPFTYENGKQIWW